ncbi:hypothetical protein [Rothia sp. 11273D007AR]
MIRSSPSRTLDRQAGGSPSFTWTYSGVLQPGESVEIPLRYYVNFPFWNVQYELFVAVTVIDEMDGDSDDNFEHMGVTQGRVIY